MNKATDMQGRVALVTGAASGLGRGTAIALARAGADLCIADIDPAGLEATREDLAQYGVQCLVQTVNLCDPQQCHALVEQTVATFGKLNALCNVAGVIYFNHSTDMPAEHWNKTLAVNLSAPFFLSQAAIPHLLEQNGAIVNVSSSAIHIGEAYAAAYCASKAGITHLTRALAMEYMHKPIRINAIAPGGMATNIAASMANLPEDLDFSLMARFKPLRGLVEIEDAAGLIAFLASDGAEAYHGACISIDKGISAG